MAPPPPFAATAVAAPAPATAAASAVTAAVADAASPPTSAAPKHIQEAADAHAAAPAVLDDDAAAALAGMGLALLPSGAAAVRVWVPHAAAVEVEVERASAAGDRARYPLALADMHCFAGRLPPAAVRHGDRYRFVLSTHAGQEGLLRRDPFARAADYASEWCFVQDHERYQWSPAGSAWTRPAFDTYAIYELHVGSFTPEGTFVAATEKLAHIAACGFTAVQLMPILEHSDLWGYNPRQFLALHGAYGKPDEFKAFVDAAHSLGIAVIVDVVLHHGAVDGNALWNYDGWSENNNGGIYHENAPDTEWGRALAHWKLEVMDMLKASCAMYIQEYKCDGLRFDSANDLPHEACQALTWSCRERFPGVFLSAEVTPENPMAIHHLGFDSLWVHSGYFDIIHQHRALGRGHHGGGEFAAGWDFGKLRTVFALHYGFTYPTQCIKYLTGSHDQVGCKNGGAIYEDYKMIGGQHRYAADQFGGGRHDPHARSAVRAWFTVNVCAAGVPMMFMGTEWSQPGWWNCDDHRRLDWALSKDDIGPQMVKFISTAMALRKKYPALRVGAAKILHEDRANGIIAVERTLEGSARIIIVLNAGLGCWQASEYGVHVGGSNYSLEEVFSSQSDEFGGWAEQTSNAAKVIPVHEGRIHVNVPTQSACVFTPVL